MAKFQAKRIYDDPSKDDGYRVLVDRLWPRGVSKERAHLDLWAKAVAPSDELRKAYHHEGMTDADFREKYAAELKDSPAVKELLAELPSGTVTLLTATKEIEHSAIPVLLKALKSH